MTDIPFSNKVEMLRVTAVGHEAYSRSLGFSPDFRELRNNRKPDEIVKVLDVAAGRSNTAQFINETIPGVQVHRLDPWYATHTPEYQELYKAGNAEQLPYINGEFDEVWCMNLLTHVSNSDRITMIKEMLRVTKEGGFVRFFPIQPNDSRMRISDIYGSGTGRKAWLYKPEPTVDRHHAVIIHKQNIDEEVLFDQLGSKVKFNVPIF